MEMNEWNNRNRWGFKVAVTQTQTGAIILSDLISVNIEEPSDWTLHLNALRYQGGQLPVGASFPADNQTQSLTGSSPPGWKANIVFGSGDASESCVVDYYARGNTVPLHGSVIRVALSGNINASNNGLAPPILSGFISPRQRSSALAMSPTFTTAVQSVPALGSVRYAIPDRAVAYRYVIVGNSALGRQIEQQDSGGAITTRVDYGIGGAPLASFTEQSNMQGWVPLAPDAQFMLIRNLDGVLTQSMQLTFLLDLG